MVYFQPLKMARLKTTTSLRRKHRLLYALFQADTLQTYWNSAVSKTLKFGLNSIRAVISSSFLPSFAYRCSMMCFMPLSISRIRKTADWLRAVLLFCLPPKAGLRSKRSLLFSYLPCKAESSALRRSCSDSRKSIFGKLLLSLNELWYF